MSDPDPLPPLDSNADDSADANRERAEQFLRAKLMTASGPRKAQLERELRRVQEERAP